MKKRGLLHTQLISEIAEIGHTQTMVIGDVGLPVPKGVKTIDLALVPGTPSFLDVLRAVEGEMVCESYVLANEIKEKNPSVHTEIQKIMQDYPGSYVDHEELKRLSEKAQVIVRTGETSSYANIILTAGVNF